MPENYKNFSKTKPMKLEHFEPAIEWNKDKKEINLDGFDKAKKYSIDEIISFNYNMDLCGYPHEEEEILPPKKLIKKYKDARGNFNSAVDKVLKKINDLLS